MSDDDLLTIYENESYIGGVEGVHAGLRAVFDAGRDSRDGIDPEVLNTIRAEMDWLGKCGRNDAISMGDLSALIPALRRLLAGHTTDKEI